MGENVDKKSLLLLGMEPRSTRTNHRKHYHDSRP